MVLLSGVLLRLPAPRRHLLGDVRRNLFVTLELHRVRRPTLGGRAHVGCVSEHLASGTSAEMTCALPRCSIPLTWPRRRFRSPITSPMYSSGVTTSTRRPARAAPAWPSHASLKRQRAGDLEGDLRGVGVVVLAVGQRDRRRPSGSRPRGPFSIASSMPFSTAGMNSVGIEPPLILLTKSKPSPGAGSMLM
jgi:hypothetical protein